MPGPMLSKTFSGPSLQDLASQAQAFIQGPGDYQVTDLHLVSSGSSDEKSGLTATWHVLFISYVVQVTTDTKDFVAIQEFDGGAFATSLQNNSTPGTVVGAIYYDVQVLFPLRFYAILSRKYTP